MSESARNYPPVQVPNLSNVTAIAAGTAYSLALKQDGTVWACLGSVTFPVSQQARP